MGRGEPGVRLRTASSRQRSRSLGCAKEVFQECLIRLSREAGVVGLHPGRGRPRGTGGSRNAGKESHSAAGAPPHLCGLAGWRGRYHGGAEQAGGPGGAGPGRAGPGGPSGVGARRLGPGMWGSTRPREGPGAGLATLVAAEPRKAWGA